MARMDSNRTAEDFFRAHPEWFARDNDGDPYRAADKYVTCINSPYYEEYLPGVLRGMPNAPSPTALPIIVGPALAPKASAIATTAFLGSAATPAATFPARPIGMIRLTANGSSGVMNGAPQFGN